MAMEVSRKWEHFYQLWQDKGEGEYKYTPADVAAYEPSQRFLDWMESLPLVGETTKRANEVDAMRPTYLHSPPWVYAGRQDAGHVLRGVSSL